MVPSPRPGGGRRKLRAKSANPSATDKRQDNHLADLADANPGATFALLKAGFPDTNTPADGPAIIGPGLIREFQRQNLPPPCRSVKETKWHAAGPTMTLRK